MPHLGEQCPNCKEGILQKGAVETQALFCNHCSQGFLDVSDTEARILIIHKIADEMKKHPMYRNVTVDNDHKSAEVIFTAPNGKQYVLSTSDIREYKE